MKTKIKEDMQFENPYKKLLIDDYWKTHIGHIELSLRSLTNDLTSEHYKKYNNALKEVRELEKKVKEIKKTIYEQYKKVRLK